MKKVWFILIIFFIPIVSYSSPITRQEIQIMNKLGVRMALKGEKPYIVPKNILPRDIVKTELIDLSGITLNKLPKWFYKFKNLRKIDLNNTGVLIPSVFSYLYDKKLASLEVLLLKGAKKGEHSDIDFYSFSKNIPNIKILDLSYVDFHIGNIKDLCSDSLIELHLKDATHLSLFGAFAYNPDFKCLKNLKILDLSDHSIDVDDLDANWLPNSLEVLDLRNNFGSKMHESFNDTFVLPNLIQLRVSSDVSIPSGLRKRLSGN